MNSKLLIWFISRARTHFDMLELVFIVFVISSYIVSLDHVDWGVLEQPGVTVGLSETPGGSWTPSPGLGQHNQYVLEEILGMNQKDIELLRSSGALT